MHAEEEKLASDICPKCAIVIDLGGPGDLSVAMNVNGLARLPAMLPA